jgi:hypothetical protein
MSELRELLDLPREVKKSDFVVRLTEGVAHPAEIVQSYAVTPDILHNLDRALGLVQAAMRDQHSEAAYVHGSFGSGKSHFMAVLSLMLANEPAVWAEPAFHALRVKHEWIKERRVLRLHFHMVGARTSEEKIFPAYLDYVRTHHPDAPLPALFEDEGLFDNAEKLRQALGDEAFFAGLDGAASARKGWGKLPAQAVWDAAAFERARHSTDREERERLFSALVRSHFPAFAEGRSSLVSLDIGLGRMTRHAARLGYHAVVLFLDELILWLASLASNQDWLAMEIQKLAKLVEAQDERRDIPLVSFIARQRDIGEMVGDRLVGMDMQNVRDSLRWWEGRFNTIKLEDRNLPTVVEKRVVRPRDAAARQRLDQAFETMRRTLGPQAWGTLLGELGDEKGFRQVYPFSPALIEALVALSHYLQRERTALKVLVELLVEHMEDFALGKVVPAGDLFDVLAGGEEPMDGHMRELFGAARRLYHTELLPRIQAENRTGTRERCQRMRDGHPVYLGCSNCAESRCRADNRLIKTLLLAALVPELPILRGLTVSRLVQLNHGTLRSPIPGTETSMAAERLRAWSSEIGKLRVEGENDPRVYVVLEGVDVRPIIGSASGYDTPGARRKLLREILFEAMDVPPGDGAVLPYKLSSWRGTRRQGAIRYGNVREMDDAALRVPENAEFQVVIDYPFDEPGHRPEEDERRVAEFVAGQRAATVVWLPNFFGERVSRDLGELAVIGRILDDPMAMHLANLRPDDQRRARDELEHLLSQKRQRVRRAIEAAYGLRKPEEGEIDTAYQVDRHVHVLWPGWEIRGVTESVLARAVEKAAQELLDRRYPRHPYFGSTVTGPRVRGALERMEKLCESEAQRLPITRQERGDWEVLEALGIVEVTEAWAALRAEWKQDIDRALRQDGIEQAPTAAQLRKRLDPGGQRGLLAEVADLEVMAYALAARRELVHGGVPVRDAAPGKLDDDVELVQTPLPAEKPWQDAIDRAGTIFGVSLGGRARSARNLRALFEKVTAARQKAVTDRAADIAGLLGRWGALLAPDAPRLRTAQRAAALLDALHTRDAVALAEALGRFEPAPSSWPALARHVERAGRMARALEDDVLLGVFEALAGRTHGADSDAGQLLSRARAVLAADELNQDLAEELRGIGVAAQRLLHAPGTGTDTDTDTDTGLGTDGDDRDTGVGIVASGEGVGLEKLDAARDEMARALETAGPGARLEFSWRVIER